MKKKRRTQPSLLHQMHSTKGFAERIFVEEHQKRRTRKGPKKIVFPEKRNRDRQ
jgi:hypothetical protein